MWALPSLPDRYTRNASLNKTISNVIFHDCRELWSARFLSRVLRRNVSSVPTEASWQTFRNGILPRGGSSPSYISFVFPYRARLATKNTGLSFVCFARAFRTLKEQNEFLLPHAHMYTQACAQACKRVSMR